MITCRLAASRARTSPPARQKLPSLKSQGVAVSFVTLIATSALAADSGMPLENHFGDSQAIYLRAIPNFAEQVNADAQLGLGLIYRLGNGRARDQRAAAWSRNTAPQSRQALLDENGEVENVINAGPNGCVTTHAESGIALSADCPVSQPQLPEWRCKIIADYRSFDGPAIRECRSQYGEFQRLACNPRDPDCHFAGRRTGLGIGAKFRPLETMPWPLRPKPDSDSSRAPGSLPLPGCRSAAHATGSMQFASCGRPNNARPEFLLPLPEWKCRIVSDNSAWDGEIVYNCKSLYGETRRIFCNPRDIEGCRLPASPRVYDGPNFQRGSLDALIRPLSVLAGSSASSLTSEAGFGRLSSSATPALAEWKCFLVRDDTFRDVVTFECRSLFGERRSISCDKSRPSECSLPAQPQHQSKIGEKAIPLEPALLPSGHFSRLHVSSDGLANRQAGIEFFEWKCSVVRDNSHVDGFIEFQCLSRYGERQSIVVGLAAATRSSSPLSELGPLQRLILRMPEIPEDEANFVTGIGDGMSLGAGRIVRSWAGLSGEVDVESGAYNSGSLIGSVVAGGSGGATIGRIVWTGLKASKRRHQIAKVGKVSFNINLGRNARTQGISIINHGRKGKRGRLFSFDVLTKLGGPGSLAKKLPHFHIGTWKAHLPWEPLWLGPAIVASWHWKTEEVDSSGHPASGRDDSIEQP